MLFGEDKLEAVFGLINTIIPNRPVELALEILFVDGGPAPLLVVSFIWAGSRLSGLKYSQMFNATGPEAFTESTLSWVDLPTKSAGGAFQLGCIKGINQDLYSANLKYFNLTTMRSIYTNFGEFLQTYLNANGSIWLMEVFGQQGENAVPPERAAYPNRGHDNILVLMGQHIVTIPLQKQQTATQRTHAMKLHPLLDGKLYVYQNYAHRDEPLQSIFGYGPERIPKLQCLKQRYDPHNVFNGYHDIPLPPWQACF